MQQAVSFIVIHNRASFERNRQHQHRSLSVWSDFQIFFFSYVVPEIKMQMSAP